MVFLWYILCARCPKEKKIQIIFTSCSECMPNNLCKVMDILDIISIVCALHCTAGKLVEFDFVCLCMFASVLYVPISSEHVCMWYSWMIIVLVYKQRVYFFLLREIKEPLVPLVYLIHCVQEKEKKIESRWDAWKYKTINNCESLKRWQTWKYTHTYTQYYTHEPRSTYDQEQVSDAFFYCNQKKEK